MKPTPCAAFQIVHLKRFQFVNGRWIKSQKIVKFPRENFDPSAFLAPRDLGQHCLHSRSESEDLLRVGEDNLSSISAPAGLYNLPKGAKSRRSPPFSSLRVFTIVCAIRL